MSSEPSRRFILWYFLGLFTASIFLLGWLFRPFLSIIILAAVVTSVFKPFFTRLADSGRIPPAWASLITCIVIFFTLFIPIMLVVGVLSKEAFDFYTAAKNAVLSDQVKNLMADSKIIDRANLILSKFNLSFSGEQINQGVTDSARAIGLFLYKQASAIASNTLKFFLNFFFMLLVIFFLLIDGPRLADYIIDLSPLPREQDEKLIEKFKNLAGAILIGNGLGGLIQGVCGGAVFYFFGLKSSFLWGVVMGLLAFLPIVGIGLVFLPAAVYLFLKERLAAALFFIVFYGILSGCIEYIFKPKIVGRRVQMHTLLVFLSIIGGLRLFGILGIIYGPLIATAFLTLSDIYRHSYQRMVEPVESAEPAAGPLL